MTAVTEVTSTGTGGVAGALSEGSLLPRFVALLTPLFTIAAGWLAGVVAQYTGAELDQTEIVAFMTIAATSALGAAWKWLQGWQQHEQRVAQGVEAARTPVTGPVIPHQR